MFFALKECRLHIIVLARGVRNDVPPDRLYIRHREFLPSEEKAPILRQRVFDDATSASVEITAAAPRDFLYVSCCIMASRQKKTRMHGISLARATPGVDTRNLW